MSSVIEHVLEIYYSKRSGVTDIEPDPRLLFKIICEYIKENNWLYDGVKQEPFPDFFKLPHSATGYTVNCFHLTKLMVELSNCIGIPKENCTWFEIENFRSINSNKYIPQCFDQRLKCNSLGVYEFDVHCIPYINEVYYDLMFGLEYNSLNMGVDIYSILLFDLQCHSPDVFEYYLPFMSNVNEKRELGWTLLHFAYQLERYDKAKLLLEYGAYDNIADIYGISANNILSIKMLTMKNSSQLSKAEECIQLKVNLETKKACAMIQALWKGYKTRKTIKESQPVQDNIANISEDKTCSLRFFRRTI